MKSLEILKKEHGLIRHALDIFSLAQEELEMGECPPKEFFEKAVEFSRTFADRFHHFKEEYLMFGLLAEKKEGFYDGEIGALRYQHERGRRCVDKIETSIEGYSQHDAIATTMLLENLAAYIALLKLHIYIEDQIFFRMVEKDLSEEEDRMLLEQFRHEEKRIGSEDFFENSRKVILEMSSIIKQWHSTK
jgi:hemerythrin-like domain-containing protein